MHNLHLRQYLPQERKLSIHWPLLFTFIILVNGKYEKQTPQFTPHCDLAIWISGVGWR